MALPSAVAAAASLITLPLTCIAADTNMSQQVRRMRYHCYFLEKGLFVPTKVLSYLMRYLFYFAETIRFKDQTGCRCNALRRYLVRYYYII